MTTEPTVYIVDNDPAVRDSLEWLMSSVSLPVEVFESAQKFLDTLQPNLVGCLLLDVRMPVISGLELMRKYSEKIRNLPVIIITGHGDVDIAVEAMKLGAYDFIEKPFKNQLLLDLVQKAINEGRHIAEENSHNVEIEQRFDSLTEQEGKVLGQLMSGEMNKGIASNLCISEKTVEVHRSKVMRKMQATSLTSLIKMCMRIEPFKHHSQIDGVD